MNAYAAKRRRLRLVVLLAALLPLCLMAHSTALGTTVIANECVGCGGAAGSSASYRIHDTVGQGPIGAVLEGTGMRGYDGFWLTLPVINVPVEGAFFATVTESGEVVLRWTVASLAAVQEFRVYRATSEDGPFALVSDEWIPPASPGEFVDAEVWPETTFWYELRVVYSDGSEDVVGSHVSATTTGRLSFALYTPMPNPSPGATSVRFDLPDHFGPVRLAVYSVNGRLVRTIVDGALERGRYTMRWDGRDESGRTVSSGVYFCRLETDGQSRSAKIILLR